MSEDVPSCPPAPNAAPSDVVFTMSRRAIIEVFRDWATMAKVGGPKEWKEDEDALVAAARRADYFLETLARHNQCEPQMDPRSIKALNDDRDARTKERRKATPLKGGTSGPADAPKSE